MRVLPPLKLASLLLAAFSLPSAHAQQYDAIVIGSGPGGLVAAEYLSRDPTVSVLILEAGPLSLAATGGTDSPDYAVGSGLTKFDIPGEYDNTIYNSANDKYRVDWINGPYMWLGKLVGGCSSINAALYFRPPDSYVTNMQWPFSAARVASLMDENEKIHGATDKPSPDGQWYTQEGYNVVSNVLRQYAGYSEKTINDAAARNSKAKTFGHAPFTFKGGKRDTPANAFWSLMKNRSNVKLIASATVNYIIHSGAVATGVVYNSNVQVGLTGRGAVLMAAGAMSTPKVLIQSGIGPSDQLNMLNRADFPGIQRGGWVVNNNVGKSLFDTNVVFASFSHPDMTSFQYKTKPASAINQYMANGAHTGAWASSGPTLIAYDTYAVNGRSYDFQITVLTNGFGDYYGNSKAFTTSLYVNNPEARAASGFTSDGKWNAFVSGDAYFGTTNDLNAMQSYATKVVDWMKQGGATFLSAANGQSTASWVAANDGFITHHFGGSCYASSNTNDAKRCADEKLRVVGTTNVFVADGSAMRDGTVNPYGFIMYIGREAASQAQAYIASGNPNPSTCSAIENGVDYTGNDIGSAASATAANCCNVCSSTSGCGAFSWTNYNGGTCWLKSGKGATTTAAGVTSGVVSTSSSSCSALVNNVDYAGNDIGNAASGAATGCCALCKAQSGCKAYTWTNYSGGTCWLKSAKGAASTVTGAISGEVGSSSTSSCSAIEENVDYTANDVGNAASATADNCCTLCKAQAGCGAFTWTNYNGGTCWLKSGKGATTTKSGARSAVLTTSTPTCTLVNNVDYYGNDLASAASSTAANCCTLCRARTGCKAFTWTDASGGTCWLKTVQGASTTKAGAVSGTI